MSDFNETMITPLKMEGNLIKLEPLELKYAEQLFNQGKNSDIATPKGINPYSSFSSSCDSIKRAMKLCKDKKQIPFAIIDINLNQAIGEVRYYNFRIKHHCLSIGYTWLGRDFQRTRSYIEAKYLLLKHAFENFKAKRVEFKTDTRNLGQQRALQSIGAYREGVLRKNIVDMNGKSKDTAVYSIIDTEWNTIKDGLMKKLLSDIIFRKEN